jgi:hypothetical protein
MQMILYLANLLCISLVSRFIFSHFSVIQCFNFQFQPIHSFSFIAHGFLFSSLFHRFHSPHIPNFPQFTSPGKEKKPAQKLPQNSCCPRKQRQKIVSAHQQQQRAIWLLGEEFDGIEESRKGGGRTLPWQEEIENISGFVVELACMTNDVMMKGDQMRMAGVLC